MKTKETSRWVFTARLRPQFRMPAVRNAPELRSQHDAAPPVQLQYPGERRAAAANAGIAIGANFKIYLLRQFCSHRVEIFYNTQETQTQKMMDQNFEIRIL